MKKKMEIDSIALHHANLAVFAERDGDFEGAGKQWHRASEASFRPDAMLLYKEAAMRCERRAKENKGKPDHM
ncbi:MAG: hypothetical protein P4L43_00755 [Syntrophobacteraceae bacterium]|nr:hypothetical protein [Syntrophobacteraceae bacterium]